MVNGLVSNELPTLRALVFRQPEMWGGRVCSIEYGFQAALVMIASLRSAAELRS